MPLRQVKIVATLGPASDSEAMIEKLALAGVDVFRLNCSHASESSLRDSVVRIRRVSERRDRPLGILLDLSGPKLRTGKLRDGGPVTLVEGATFRIDPAIEIGDEHGVCCTHRPLAKDVVRGDRLLLDDGLLELEVIGLERAVVVRGVALVGPVVERDVVVTRVAVGGPLGERKGLNLPDSAIDLPALSEKDRRDLALGLELGVDFVALSFVQRADDVRQLRTLIQAAGLDVPIVAKLERPNAIAALTEILEVTDLVMVARGDLGVEAGFHRVPMIQKQILYEASRRAIPDVTATQMLDSMIRNPRPTRAEASDVANAILDGTDAVMLSGETSTGRYPIESVQTLDRIARDVESQHALPSAFAGDDAIGHEGPATDVARAAVNIVRSGRYSAIVVLTGSGTTARLLSAFGPRVPIFALTPSPTTQRRLTIVRGVHPIALSLDGSTEQILASGERELVRRGFLRGGDDVVWVSGSLDSWGVTHLLKILRVRTTDGPVCDSRPAITKMLPIQPLE